MAYAPVRVTPRRRANAGPGSALADRHEGRDAGAHPEAAGVVAVGGPDVDAGAADPLAGVVDEEPAEEPAAGEQLDVAGEREDARVRRDDPRPHLAAAPGDALETVCRQRDRDRLAGARPRE